MTRSNVNIPDAEPLAAAAGSQNGDHPMSGSEHPTSRTIGTIRPTIVVLGAAGAIGAGVLRAGAAAGDRLVAVGGDERKLARLRREYPEAKLVAHTAPIATERDALRLAEALRREDRPIAGVVDAMWGGAGRGRLMDRPADALRQALAANLLPHLAAARHLIPLLAEHRRGGGYVLIGGPGSDAPWSNYGYRSVTAAALRMLARVLHDEAQPFGVRVQMLVVESPVRGASPSACHCPQWPTGDDVGRQALRLIARDFDAQPARPVVYFGRHVDPGVLHTTSRGQRVSDVRSFLKTLTSADRNEVSDDTP
jgi:NAD(P)-dependent dehydrogenase (short-subunit alcohol dehydrogenase family)